MHQFKELLKEMGFEIVVEEMENTEWAKNDGFFVAKNKDTHYRVHYTVDSYGNEPSIVSVKEVKPQQVTKVEYV